MTSWALLTLTVCYVLTGCNEPTTPVVPNEVVFLARNDAGVGAGARVVAIQATTGSDVVDLGSTGNVHVKLDDRGAIVEGYIVAGTGGASPGIVSIKPRDRFSQQVLLADEVAGGALVEAPGIGTVLVVKDVWQCDIRAYHAGTEIWRRSVAVGCQTKYEQIGQIGNLVVTLQASTQPTGLVDPATGNMMPFVYPAERCTPIGEVGLKPVYGCIGPNSGDAVGDTYVQVEGGAPIVDYRFDHSYPLVLEAPQHDDAVVLGGWESVFYHIDKSGRVLSRGTPPNLGPGNYFGRPILSPDSSFIYYSTTQGVIAQSLATGSKRLITSSSTQSVATSHDGKFMYALTRNALDVIYIPTAKRVATYPEDARDILLVAATPPGLTPSASKPPSLASPAITPNSTSPTPVTLPIGCRLPIDKYGAAEGRVDGFLNVCTGVFKPDPTSAITFDSKSGLSMTVAKPVLFGTAGLSYVRQVSRWVPASVNAVSPDGQRYVYLHGVWRPNPSAFDPRGTLDHWEFHVVDTATAADQVVRTGPLTEYFIIVRFTSLGVYLTQACPSGCASEHGHLWLLEPDTGRISKVTDVRGYGWHIDGNYAWANSDLFVDSDVASGGRTSPPPRTVFRLNLSSGQLDQWFTCDRCGTAMVALDSAGEPLLTATDPYRFDSPIDLVRLSSPGHYEFVARFVWGESLDVLVTNPEGTWFYEGGYFYLYNAPSQPQAVVATGGYVYQTEGQLGQ
jgi:hypothetical protein